MDLLNDVYDLTTDIRTAYDLQTKQEIDSKQFQQKALILKNSNKTESEKILKLYRQGKAEGNHIKIISDDKLTYYFVDDKSRPTCTFRNRVLKLIEVSEDTYQNEISKKTKVKTLK